MNMQTTAAHNPVPQTEPSADSIASPRMESLFQPRAPQGEVRLSIERLRIDGLDFTSRQSGRLHNAVERELARLLQMQPLRVSASAIATLRAPHLTFDQAADPDAVGVDIARSLFAALRDEQSGSAR